MTAEDRNQTIIIIKGLLAKDIEAATAKYYTDEDLATVVVEEFSLPEMIDLLRRASKQMLAQLESENWKILPSKVLDLNQRQVTIGQQFGSIFTYLNNGQGFDEWIHHLIFIIRYEMHHGFWDRSRTRIHNPKDLGLNTAQTKLNLLAQNLEKIQLTTEANKQELQEGINELTSFTEQKEQEFESLAKTLEAALRSLSNIRDAESQAASSNGKISTLLDQVDKTLDASRKRIGQDRKQFEDTHTKATKSLESATEQLALLTSQREEFDKLVVSATQKEQHILDQQEHIMTLIGFAADGTLGGVFNNRKKELQWPVLLWTALSLASVGLAVFWVLYVFKQTPSQDHNGVNWLILAANVVRTSPVFLLVYFCLSQYTKERNIQEEYAFKAAISMTVTAYADMIGTGEVNERVKMLMDTIQRIYVPPVLGKPVKPVSVKTKHLAQAAKSMADTASNLKTTVTDTLKSIKPEKPA